MIMKTLSGLDIVAAHMPTGLHGKRIGILSHASSITSDFRYITEIFGSDSGCRLAALFGPQHGIFGQTQDNMIEWEGTTDPLLRIPVYSLYGEHRQPSPHCRGSFAMLPVEAVDRASKQ